MDFVVVIFGFQVIYSLLPVRGQYVAVIALKPLIDLNPKIFNAQIAIRML